MAVRAKTGPSPQARRIQNAELGTVGANIARRRYEVNAKCRMKEKRETAWSVSLNRKRCV